MVTSKVPLPWHPSVSSCFSRPTPPPLEPRQRASRVTKPVAAPVSPPVTAASLARPKLDYVPPPPVGPRRTKPSPETLPPPPIGVPPPKPRLVPASVPIPVPMLAVQASPRPTLEIPRVTTREPTRNRRPWLRLGSMLGTAASLLLAMGIASSTISAPLAERAPAPEEMPMATGLRASLTSAWPSPAVVAQPEPSPAELQEELPTGGSLETASVDPTTGTEPRLEPTPQPRRSRRTRHQPHASHADAAVEATPAPVPATDRSSSPRRGPVSAVGLLRDGEAALARGDAERAYQLAKRSRNTDPSASASRLVARAACLLGKRNEARQALRDLPLFERGAVRRGCRRSGGRIGL